MSTFAMGWAMRVKGLPIATKAVLMILAECHNGETGQCNPSMRFLQEVTGLKERAIQLHLKALERAGLIERTYAYHGRGKGCSVEQYHLKIGITGAVKKSEMEPQDIAPAKECARKIPSMRPQNIAAPYKEEPEENRKTKSVSSSDPDFQQAWALYQTCEKKVGQTKKLAKQHWPKAVKRAGGSAPILKAIEIAVAKRRDPEGFVSNLPDMFRWLRDDCWRDLLEAAEPVANSDMTDAEWATAMRHWCDTGEWLVPASPAPDQPGCKAPAKMLRHAAKIVPDKADAINANLKLGAAA